MKLWPISQYKFVKIKNDQFVAYRRKHLFFWEAISEPDGFMQAQLAIIRDAQLREDTRAVPVVMQKYDGRGRLIWRRDD